ncbi:unnamed protein product, partial [Cylindrotheca closterium]
MVTLRSNKEYNPTRKTPTKKAGKTPRKPTPSKISSSSKSGESSRSRTSHQHVWPLLLEDIEVSGGIQRLVLEGGQSLERLLKDVIAADEANPTGGNKLELYGRKGSAEREVIRMQVNRWKKQDAKQYRSTLERYNILAFANRTIKIEDSLISALSTDYEGDDSDSSLASSRPPTLAPPQTQRKTKQRLKYPPPATKRPPAPVSKSLPIDKATPSTTHPLLPPESSSPQELEQLDESNNTMSDMSEPKVYNPENKDPMHTWPFVVVKIKSLEGVDEHQGELYEGRPDIVAETLKRLKENRSAKVAENRKRGDSTPSSHDKSQTA